MGILDIIIAILFLVLVIFGFINGFLKQILSSMAWLIALVAATLFCKVVSNMLMDTGVGLSLIGTIYNWLSGKGDAFTTAIPELTESVLTQLLSDNGIPTFLHSALLKVIDLSTFKDISIAEFLSPKVASLLLNIISYIIIYLVVFITLKILAKIFSHIVRSSALGIIDGILGAIWGAIKATIIVSVFMLLISFVVTMPWGQQINEWFIKDISIAKSGLKFAKFFYEYNPILQLISYISSLK